MKKHHYRFKIHDRFQIELKFDYPIRPNRSREEVRVETFCFIPPTLYLNPTTYTKNDFYQDLQTYTRYGTPRLSIERLLDPQNELSPLYRVARTRGEFAAGRSPDLAAERVVYELRILACIFRGETRDQGTLITELLSKPQPSAKDFEDAAYLAGHFVEETGRMRSRVQEMQREFLGPHVPAEVTKGFAYVDEAMSVQLEGVSGKLYQRFTQALQAAADSGAAYPEVTETARKLAAVMQDEEAYRRQAGYPTLVYATGSAAAGQANEYFLYRMGVLKKFAQSTLFLSVQTQPGSRPLLYTLYALAAMGAMAFFVGLLFFLQDVAPLNSLPYIVLAVIGYAFKDRIKDSLKLFFSERMTGWLRDRETKLIDRGPTKAVVGSAAEAFSFVEMGRVPEEVLVQRARDELTELAEEGRPESVFKYQKAITLYADQVFKLHRRVDRLNEILRLSVRSMLFRMDEPKKGLLLLETMDPEASKPAAEHEARLFAHAQAGGNGPELEREKNGHGLDGGSPRDVGLTPLHRLRTVKVYHVILILRVLNRDDLGRWQSDLQKFRLILSRNGIERVEFMEDGEKKILLP